MVNEKLIIEFGLKIRKIRIKKNLSQEKLSFLTGFHRTYIGMIERAEKNITLLNIEKIANALDVKITDLIKQE
jgi:transcriptional regulator with XRE-family HTH domain